MIKVKHIKNDSYSVYPRDPIFVKAFSLLLKNTRRNIGKFISTTLSSKYIQKLLDHAKQSARDALKTASKRAIQKTAEATVDLNGNKIADRIMNVSNTSPKNN